MNGGQCPRGGDHEWKSVDTTDGYTVLKTLRCSKCHTELDPSNMGDCRAIVTHEVRRMGLEVAMLEVDRASRGSSAVEEQRLDEVKHSLKEALSIIDPKIE